jgi:hypothetical protein
MLISIGVWLLAAILLILLISNLIYRERVKRRRQALARAFMKYVASHPAGDHGGFMVPLDIEETILRKLGYNRDLSARMARIQSLKSLARNRNRADG